MLPELRGLYALTPDEKDTGKWLAQVEAALAGGCRWLQYRDKISSATTRERRAQALQSLCQAYGAALLINDDLDLALAVDAAGVHLGRDDGGIGAARARLGDKKLIGASCYNDFLRARAAEAAGADYLAFGAIFASPTKPQAPNAPLSLFQQGRAELARPLCAIGGITLEKSASLIVAGASLLAVITDLFSAPDITARAAAYQRLFEDYPHDIA